MIFSPKIEFLFLTTDNSENCPVRIIWETTNVQRSFLRSLHEKNGRHLLKRWFNKYSLFITNKKRGPLQIAIFGFKDPDFPLLQAINKNIIAPAWFDVNFTKSCVILFVPQGEKIIKYQQWKIFKGAVYFKEHFDFFVELKGLENERKKIFPKLFAAIGKGGEPEVIKQEMEKIITNESNRICKNPDNYQENEFFEIMYRLEINRLNLAALEN